MIEIYSKLLAFEIAFVLVILQAKLL